MYNIKQAAARAGVTVPVMRAWERRYGIVAPARTPSGYRQFDDAAVERVRTMRGLVDAGWSPSAAAAAIRSGEVAVGPAAPDEVPMAEAAPADAGIDGAAGPDLAGQLAGELASRLVAGARDLDGGALESVMDELFAQGSFERVVMDLLFPALQRLGDAWAAGEVTVAGEHLASGIVHRRLGQLLEAAGPGSAAAPRLIVGLPPGGRHELGALAFAIAARRAGLRVAYVGADLPVVDWVAAAEVADAVVIGVVTARDRRSALDVARAVLVARPRVVVAFGGEAAPRQPDVLRLPGELVPAVKTLADALT
jgi:DNA-binding transcriptional MerR regulator/methylmalonyl-CoA mutase cobalamin-binding subunit